VLATADGIAASNLVPPIIAAVPDIGGGLIAGIPGIPGIELSAKAGETVTSKAPKANNMTGLRIRSFLPSLSRSQF